MCEEGGYILTMDVKIENGKVKRIREEVEVALRNLEFLECAVTRILPGTK